MKVTMPELDDELAKIRKEQEILKNEVKQLKLEINPTSEIDDKMIGKSLTKSSLKFKINNNQISKKFEIKKEVYDRNEADINLKKKEIDVLEAEIIELVNSKTNTIEQPKTVLPSTKTRTENRFISFIKKIINRNQKANENTKQEFENVNNSNQLKFENDQQISEKRAKINDIKISIDSLENENEEIRGIRTERALELEKQIEQNQTEFSEVNSDIEKLNKDKKIILEKAPKISKNEKEAKKKQIEEKNRKYNENKDKINQIQSLQKKMDPSKYILDGILPNNFFEVGETQNYDDIIEKATDRLKQPKKEDIEITEEEYKNIFEKNSDTKSSQIESKNEFFDKLKGSVETELIEDNNIHKEEKVVDEQKKDKQEGPAI